jgi:cation transport ATPase
MNDDPHRSPPEASHAGLDLLRRLVLAILVLGMLGTAVELLLTAHTEDLAQWIPLLLIGAAFVVLGWHLLDGRGVSLRVFRWTMVLFMVSGVVGILMHYQAKAEFQMEMDPSLGGAALFWQAIRTISPPALAPGVMIQLGLLGFAYTFRNPALAISNGNLQTTTGE